MSLNPSNKRFVVIAALQVRHSIEIQISEERAVLSEVGLFPAQDYCKANFFAPKERERE
jgi:hypothetical protein